MKELGETLKASRINQNKSITDISEITKMNINIISNIEEGNVDYFRDDLTYLKYYIKSYMMALGEDIEDIDDEIGNITLEYTQTISIIEQDKLAEINEKISKKTVNTNLGSNRIKKAKNVDWTFISLISIVALIALFLIYSVVANILNNPAETPEVKPPVVLPGGDEEEEEIPEVIEKEKIEIIFDTTNSLTINNWDETTTFETKFTRDTWVQIAINNQVITLPQKDVTNKVFVANEELILTDFYVMNGEEIPFKEGDVISVRYGVMAGNEFLIDDEKIDLDPSVAESLGGTNLIYTLGKRAEKWTHQTN